MSFEQWKKEAKRLVKLAIHKAGSQHAMSDSTGVDTSQLSRWGNEDDAVRHIPLYRAMELDEAAGDAIFKGWARWRGADFVFREHRQEVAENMLKLATSTAQAHGGGISPQVAGAAMTLPHKDIDTALREIEDMLAAMLDAVETIIGDPSSASAAATLLDFGLPDIHHRVVALRAAIR